MLARLAQNFYWIGRNIERAENVARMVGAGLNIAYDCPADYDYDWGQMIAIVGSEDAFGAQYSVNNQANVTNFLLSSVRNPNSVLSSISKARENVRVVRELLPREPWIHLNEFNLWVKKTCRGQIPKRDLGDVIVQLIRGCQLFDGMLDSSLSRTRPYDFIVLGRYIERCDMVSRFLDIHSVGDYDEYWDSVQCGYILHSVSGYQMYRLTAKEAIQSSNVVRFLLENVYFPRSIAYGLSHIEHSLKVLPSSDSIKTSLTALNRFLKSQKKNKGKLEDKSELTEYIDQFQVKLGNLHQEIASHFFAV